MTQQTEALAELPKLPTHPEPHTYTWTALEMAAIEEHGLACYRAAISSQPPAPIWQPIETAPKDGTRFVNMYYVTVVGVGIPARHERHFQICHRAFSSLGSSGYWTNEHISVPDHWLRGWWVPLAHPLPAPPASLTATAGSTP